VRQIYLFVGRIQQALENVRASQNVEDMQETVARLARSMTALKKQLDPLAQRDRLNAAIDRVSANIARYAALLQLEHASENVKLNTNELTLQFSPLTGRKDFLWELGSGQNWMGYHIAGLLALHEHFASLNASPVPRFLVIDQPSQVYFPEGWPSDRGQLAVAGSTDIEGVRRVFKALSHFMDAVGTQFQIIVTEHAGTATWQGTPHTHVVGNWRPGHDDYLIPAEWINERASAD
jgi:hypothetical protein